MSDGAGREAKVDYLARLRLDGRGVVVLGGGDGIGRQTCLALAQAGARVLCVDLDRSLAEDVAREVDGEAYAANIINREDMVKLFDFAGETFGPTLKGIVNVVGVAFVKPFDEIDEETWDKQFDIVLRHAYHALQLGAPLLAANGGGSMTFVGSMSGMASIRNQTAYGAAKAALHHLVRGGASEYGARQVRVNVVVPSFIRTPRLAAKLDQAMWDKMSSTTPLGRVATPDEIAAAILFLQSDLASFVSGTVFPVDGGVTAQSPLREF
ncbi:SDR family oxidoreductase [Novosphingobium sp.]|uniref:SDR family NAD(P)-dependent oxidoreductase n=1 Tax=Novosphingobium sp. TaxID=1874826 RepID=UPI002B4A6BBD|nr:SDR family oxidoreductase [Novosphingobium sp.]HKR91763.1 SDR family oxidoreductase [Novosphingobium sp.]